MPYKLKKSGPVTWMDKAEADRLLPKFQKVLLRKVRPTLEHLAWKCGKRTNRSSDPQKNLEFILLNKWRLSYKLSEKTEFFAREARNKTTHERKMLLLWNRKKFCDAWRELALANEDPKTAREIEDMLQ